MFHEIVVIFLAFFLVFGQTKDQRPESEKHLEISYIDSDALAMLQEILASEFELVHKKIDSLRTTTIGTTTAPTTTTTAITTTGYSEEEIEFNDLPMENSTKTNQDGSPDIEFKWFVVIITTILTIILMVGFFLIVIWFTLWAKQWTNEGYFKRRGINKSTGKRPTNRESWFYLG